MFDIIGEYLSGHRGIYSLYLHQIPDALFLEVARSLYTCVLQGFRILPVEFTGRLDYTLVKHCIRYL